MIVRLIGSRGAWSTQRRRFATDDESSESSSDQDEYDNNIRNNILKASLPFVNQHGWSQESLVKGAETLGFPGVTGGLFRNGPADLIFYFYITCNKDLVKQIISIGDDVSRKKEPHEIVEEAIQMRLRMIIPYIDRWPQALGIMTLPRNVPLALSNLLTLVDDICYHAGDRSVDFNWYSRRLAIGGIYKMTELYLVQDKSEDYLETWNFLHRCMEEAVQLHTLLQNSGNVTSVAGEAVLATFTTARNILRLNQTR